MEVDGFILVSRENGSPEDAPQDASHEYLLEIHNSIERLCASLWPLNKFIHENPELAFKEYKAHSVLTNFMRARKDWQVTTSAYGMETAWIAVYDSRKRGPVVSFNVEMGMPIRRIVRRKRLR
jgi:hypothetical protein